MSKKKLKNEAQLLDLLKKVLPKATDDARLAMKIFAAVEQELKSVTRLETFETFCSKVELPDLDPSTVMDVKRQLSDAFGESEVTVKPAKNGEALLVEADLPGGRISAEIKVRPLRVDDDGEPDVALKFVPFPVVLPGDPELVWILAKRENLQTEEAGMALSKIEDAYWASKAGQKSLRDRVDRTFPEFIARVPAGMLSEAGLKRHYKTPEAIRVHRGLTPSEEPKKRARRPL